MSSQYASLLPPYIPTRGTTQLLCVVFLFTAAVSWVAVGYDFAEIRLAQVVRSGASIEPAESLAHSATGHWIGLFQIFCFAVTGCLFLVWLHRARVNVPAGTQTGQQFRLRGKGMSVLRSNARGDMYVQAQVETPVNLTKQQRELLRQFDKAGGGRSHSPEAEGFFTKVKELWEDFRE